ncbi:hypothetical protein B0H17DRAFT_1108268 [Mycena rosella]|uniref:Secreted protein n=1 Tax=Mycena rosella TaxID=1033263 RepID=A0AAD7FPF5_MYCRO|nr:hypothetical protein B0H17DRAFT_1108268 [Mycena rosella]
MKLIVSIILSFLAAAVANVRPLLSINFKWYTVRLNAETQPTDRHTRSCGLPASGQERQFSSLGYSCPAVGAPVLGGGGSSSSACEADCSCVEICP